MRIGYLYLDALRPGGYPRDIRWLADAVSRQGHEIFLVTDDGPELDGLGATAIVPPAELGKLYPSLDVLHFWGLFLPRQVGYERQVRKLHGRIPTVVSPLAHLMPLHLGRSTWKKLPYLGLLRPLLRSDQLVAHFFSEEEYWASLRYLQPTLHFEASLGLFPPRGATTAVEGLGDYLLFFGRNDITQKGLDVLVEGYRLARREGLEIPLVVAGHSDRGSEAYWQRVANEGELAGAVTLAGEVPEGATSRLLAEARALVFPSRWDGPPRPIREAIAVGTPVIVTNGTNMGQLVEGHNAGQLVALEASSIASALFSAADPSIAAGWREGVERLRDTLSWDRVARTYLDGYELASSNPGRR